MPELSVLYWVKIPQEVSLACSCVHHCNLLDLEQKTLGTGYLGLVWTIHILRKSLVPICLKRGLCTDMVLSRPSLHMTLFGIPYFRLLPTLKHLQVPFGLLTLSAAHVPAVFWDPISSIESSSMQPPRRVDQGLSEAMLLGLAFLELVERLLSNFGEAVICRLTRLAGSWSEGMDASKF